MIWCVEDDPSIREIEVYALNSTGLEARGFADGEEFWKALEGETPELVLLDVMLPGEDGVAILKRLRGHERWRDIPVIMATAKGTEFDKVQSLDLGADDYITKPFGMMEMVSRVKAVLRRVNHTAPSPTLTYKTIELNEASHRVSVEGKNVELTVKEYELLRLFLKNPGVAFTRDNLLSSIWESEFQGETRTVDVHIASLRTKLGAAGEYIKTLRGVGYRLEENRD